MLIEGWVEPDYWIGSTVNAESGRDGELAVARAVRSSRTGCSVRSRCGTSLQHHKGSPRCMSSTMRLPGPAEFADAYLAAGLDFARLPHMLHPGRPVYVGAKT